MTCNMRFVFLFKQKTAYEMRISDWSSDVCSSDLAAVVGQRGQAGKIRRLKRLQFGIGDEAGAGFFRLRQTEFRRRYGLYAKGAEKFPDLADLTGLVTGAHQLAGLELSARLFLALRLFIGPPLPLLHPPALRNSVVTLSGPRTN